MRGARSLGTLCCTLCHVNLGRVSLGPVHLAIVVCFSVIPTVLLVFLVFLVFFEKGLAYRVETNAEPLASEAFLRILTSIADAELRLGSHVEALVNGQSFYAAQLDAISRAQSSIHLEQYIFNEGTIGSRFIDALVERARAGVRVRVNVDYVGSVATSDSFFDSLRAAGGTVAWYQPPRWYTFKHLSNRSHRKILVVDGVVGFLGGAGIADEWLTGTDDEPAWRDTMFRVSGGFAHGLQTCFVENWVESTGEILTRAEYFPIDETHETTDIDSAGVVVISSPQAGRSTRARVVYAALIDSATRSIDLSTPYFLPDEPMLHALVRAIQRGVRVRLLTAGPRTDQLVSRASGQSRFGALLAAGGEIYEYATAMMHAKALVVDDLWCVVGSANLDNRSLALNDEVNIATRDPRLATALKTQLEEDVGQSVRITLNAWKKRTVIDRIIGRLARILDRQS